MHLVLATPTAGSAENQRPPVLIRALRSPSVSRPAVTNLAASASSNQPDTRSEGCGVWAARPSRRRSRSSWRACRLWLSAAFRSAGKDAS